jgi:hypothetical protein
LCHFSLPLFLQFALHLDAVVADVGTAAGFNNALRSVTDFLEWLYATALVEPLNNVREPAPDSTLAYFGRWRYVTRPLHPLPSAVGNVAE